MSGGNFTITQHVAGEVITAADSNADRQDIVDHLMPIYLDDYSADLTTMRIQTDPGESGSESFASSLAGEFARLRFAVADTKQILDPSLTYWYQTPSKNVTWKNILGYGADPTGVADSTSAFQTAIALGGGILVPPGVYKITSTLTITKGVWILGTGAAPGGVVSNAHTAFPGAILSHQFNGTFIDVVGTDAGDTGGLEAGVGTRLQNLILRQNFGTAGNAYGVAIRYVATSQTHKASWLHLEDVNCEIVSNPVPTGDWTYNLYADGDATTSFTAGSARDVTIRGGRWWAGTASTKSLYCHCCVNWFVTNLFLNGTNAGMTISGSDATHMSSTFYFNGGGLGAVAIDYAQNIWMAGTQISALTTTVNTTDVQAIGGYCTVMPVFDATDTTSFFQGYINAYGHPVFTGGTGGLEVRTADRQAVVQINAPTGSNAILRLCKDDTAVWDIFRNNGDSDALRINSSSKSGIVDIVKTSGQFKHGYAVVETWTTVTYAAVMNIDWSLGNKFSIIVTDGSAFEITKSNNTSGQSIVIQISNTSGGAMGAITWTGYKLAGAAFTGPATAKNATISFTDLGGNVREAYRTSADVPN